MSRKLLKSTATVGAMTLLSRLLGFARDMVFARFFGAGAGTDAFFVAFKIPNFMRRLFGEGAFSQAFVPVLSEYKTQRDREQVQDLLNGVAGTFAAVLVLVTVVGVLAAPLLIALFAPGFIGDASKYDIAVSMLRLTFPYLLFISLTAFAGGILNTYGRFGVPAFTPVLLNLSLIAAAIWLAPHMQRPVTALAVGVFVAGVAQLLFQVPFLLRLRLMPRPRFDRVHEGVRRIMRLMLPAIFGSSVAQINLLFDTLIASFLVTGSVSWLYYSDRLMEFPLGVFGIALGTVILPSLSSRHAEAAPERFAETLDWGLRWALLIGAPASLGLMILAQPVLATLFNYGEFGAHDVRMATFSLVAFSVGLLGFILVKVLAPGFYARQDTRTPVRVGVIAMVTNIALNLLFVVPLAVSGYPAPHAGLALATSLAAFVNAALLFRHLRRERVYRAQPGWPLLGLRIGLACAAMAAFLWWGRGDVDTWLHGGLLLRAERLAGLIAGGIVVYFGVLLLLGAKLWRWKR
ncbi:MAG: murein biosynthesis integral membrane protein MurJ [Gammaproteobacteria bacterium]